MLLVVVLQQIRVLSSARSHSREDLLHRHSGQPPLGFALCAVLSLLMVVVIVWLMCELQGVLSGEKQRIGRAYNFPEVIEVGVCSSQSALSLLSSMLC